MTRLAHLIACSLALWFSGCASTAVLYRHHNEAAANMQVGAGPDGVEVGLNISDLKTFLQHPWESLAAVGFDAASAAALFKVAKDWYDRHYGSDSGQSAGSGPFPTTVTTYNYTINDNHGTITTRRSAP